MKKIVAAVYEVFGKPEEVLKVCNITLPEAKPHEALVKMEMSCMNPSDFGTIAGTYGIKRQPPSIAGWEGVGVIEKTASQGRLIAGTRVVVADVGKTWASHCLIPENRLIPIPSQVPLEQAAQAIVNPMTAWRIFHDFVKWQPGDWAVQNAANSAVGFFFIQLAKKMGVNTLNIVRRQEVMDPLKQAGATEVFLEDSPWLEKNNSTQPPKLIRLGLNSVGGKSALNLTRSLSQGGILVTFGGMSAEPIRFPTRELIFNQIQLLGFWRNLWQSHLDHHQLCEAYQPLFEAMAEGWLKAPIHAIFPLEKILEAVKENQSTQRFGKILVDMRDISS